MTIITLLILLQLKHLICDFICQGPYQYKNKDNWRHPGGYLHAGITVLGTLVAFLLFEMITGVFIPGPVLLTIFGLEFVVHYAIDWSKMNLNKILKWGPTTHEEFWWLLGLDQMLHQLCYILMLVAIL